VKTVLARTFSVGFAVGRVAVFCVGLAVVLAMTLAIVATAAEAARVKSLKAGVQNTVSAVTSMVGSVAGPVLRLDNNSTDSGATALDLQVEAGNAPMSVNSDTEVANLTAANAANADEVDGTNFTFNRTGVIQPNTSVDVLNVPNVGKIAAACGTGGDSFTLTYTNQFGASQQQIADQRSQNGNEATAGDVLSSGGTKNYSFTSDGTVNQGHRLLLQVAPSAQTSPNTQALTTFEVTALTQAGGANTCRFQGTATVQ
jgi:hypothetical protein